MRYFRNNTIVVLCTLFLLVIAAVNIRQGNDDIVLISSVTCAFTISLLFFMEYLEISKPKMTAIVSFAQHLYTADHYSVSVEVGDRDVEVEFDVDIETNHVFNIKATRPAEWEILSSEEQDEVTEQIYKYIKA